MPASLSPLAIQIMLVRVVKDAATARSVWEDVVKISLSDPAMKIPWVVSDDQLIAPKLPKNDFFRYIISGRKSEALHAALRDDAFDLSSRISRSTKIRNKLSISKFVDSTTGDRIINSSITTFDVSIGVIQFNIIDTLLGPRMPRFQLNISDIYLQGDLSHPGVAPHLSHNFSHSLHCDVFSGVTLESSFFNSKVSAHEPILEKYSLEASILKSVTDNSVKIRFCDKTPLLINVSTAVLQTAAAIILSMDGTSSQSGDDDSDVSRTCFDSILHSNILPITPLVFFLLSVVVAEHVISDL
jgi:hypothetical protein